MCRAVRKPVIRIVHGQHGGSTLRRIQLVCLLACMFAFAASLSAQRLIGYSPAEAARQRAAEAAATARYGRSFRGIKAREAEKRGAVGLFVYSDPADDGYAQGDPYPLGPMRPAQGIQRGSFLNGAGDPSTPGWASVRGTTRVPVGELQTPRIPIIPIS